MISSAILYSPNGEYIEYSVDTLLSWNLVICGIREDTRNGVPTLSIDVMDNNEELHVGYFQSCGLPFITIKELY